MLAISNAQSVHKKEYVMYVTLPLLAFPLAMIWEILKEKMSTFFQPIAAALSIKLKLKKILE
jgi:hypothetical protein